MDSQDRSFPPWVLRERVAEILAECCYMYICAAYSNSGSFTSPYMAVNHAVQDPSTWTNEYLTQQLQALETAPTSPLARNLKHAWEALVCAERFSYTSGLACTEAISKENDVSLFNMWRMTRLLLYQTVAQSSEWWWNSMTTTLAPKSVIRDFLFDRLLTLISEVLPVTQWCEFAIKRRQEMVTRSIRHLAHTQEPEYGMPTVSVSIVPTQQQQQSSPPQQPPQPQSQPYSFSQPSSAPPPQPLTAPLPPSLHNNNNHQQQQPPPQTQHKKNDEEEDEEEEYFTGASLSQQQQQQQQQKAPASIGYPVDPNFSERASLPHPSTFVQQTQSGGVSVNVEGWVYDPTTQKYMRSIL